MILLADITKVYLVAGLGLGFAWGVVMTMLIVGLCRASSKTPTMHRIRNREKFAPNSSMVSDETVALTPDDQDDTYTLSYGLCAEYFATGVRIDRQQKMLYIDRLIAKTAAMNKFLAEIGTLRPLADYGHGLSDIMLLSNAKDGESFKLHDCLLTSCGAQIESFDMSIVEALWLTYVMEQPLPKEPDRCPLTHC